MSMKLVKKKSPRGLLVRWLDSKQESAIHNFYNPTRALEPEETTIVEDLLLKMRESDLWLQCGCNADDSPAMNSANLIYETKTLFLASFSQPHALNCPMYRESNYDAEATTTGTRKSAGSRRLNYNDFLPRDESGAHISAPGLAANNLDRTRRKRLPRLARLLLTLIEDSGLNRLNSLGPLPERRASESIELLRQLTTRINFFRDRVLAEIINFKPAMGERGHEQLMQQLENPKLQWPTSRTRIYYQIFMSEHVSRDEVKFKWSGGEIAHRPERGVSINGESQEGIRPPYWVILAFRRGKDGQVICSEGYAHAMYSRKCPIPVDSNLERNSLTSISTVAGWLKKTNEYPRMSLVKPLFDIEVEVDGEKGFVLPDFIVSVQNEDQRTHSVVVETMGYTDDEYCERKSEQHLGMKLLGRLCTDPPKWPTESNKAFDKYLYGIIKNTR